MTPLALESARHAKPRTVLTAGLPLALLTGLAYGGGLGFTEDAQQRASAASSTAVTTITVAEDGSGQYTTVQAAVNAVPDDNTSRVVISIEPGTYRELVRIPSDKPWVTLQGSGDDRRDTVIVHDNASGTPKPGGGTYGLRGSATVTAEADEFQARNLTISNDFDEAAHQGNITDQQAIALRTAADRVVLDGVAVTGDQGTLLLDTAAEEKPGRVYVRDSRIVGNVDFVFGGSSAVIDKSVITLKKRWDGTSAGYVTAPSTAAGQKGFLIVDSRVAGDVSARSFYLGRPWHMGGDASLDPQATFRNTALSKAVRAAPWTDRSGFSWKDDRFAEYENTGAGSGSSGTGRPQLTDARAAGQEIQDWLGGWTPATS